MIFAFLEYTHTCPCAHAEQSDFLSEKSWRVTSDGGKNGAPAGVSGVSGELGYEFAVGRQEIQLTQGFRRAPFHGLEGLVADVAGCHGCFEKNQIDAVTQLGVLMARTIYFLSLIHIFRLARLST